MVLWNHMEVLLKELTELKERIDQHDVALATRGMVSHPLMAKDVPKPNLTRGLGMLGRLITSFEVWKSTSMLSDFETMHPRFKLCLFN